MKPRLRVAGCFLEHEDKFLILLRLPNKSQGNTWCLPSGKVETDETDAQAVLREIEEETGYKATGKDLEYLGEYSFEFDELYLVFPTFRIKLEEKIAVHHKPDEHGEYKWVTADECYGISNLVRGLHELLEQIGYV